LSRLSAFGDSGTEKLNTRSSHAVFVVASVLGITRRNDGN
jgi:hypothetical protein